MNTTETETRRDLEREIDSLRHDIQDLNSEILALRNFLANERSEMLKIAARINELAAFPVPERRCQDGYEPIQP